MRFILPILCIVLVTPVSEAQDNQEKFDEAFERLICQCGCNLQLSVCAMQHCHSAEPMRAEIREKLQAGVGVDEIVASFVERIGKQVMSAPTSEGFDLAAWVMPFVILGVGIVVVGWIAVRMRQPAEVGEPISQVMDSRVESELRDFEEES